MRVVELQRFSKDVKKLHKNQKSDLDNAIRELMVDPYLGEEKKGDLAGIRVYKFKMVNQESLLAYTYNNNVVILTLLRLGSHENFYRNLKKD